MAQTYRQVIERDCQKSDACDSSLRILKKTMHVLFAKTCKCNPTYHDKSTCAGRYSPHRGLCLGSVEEKRGRSRLTRPLQEGVGRALLNATFCLEPGK